MYFSRRAFTVDPTLQPTCVAFCEVGGDDLFSGAVLQFLQPGDLHHLLLRLLLVPTGKPGLALCEGALKSLWQRRLHKDTLHTHNCREQNVIIIFKMIQEKKKKNRSCCGLLISIWPQGSHY